MARWFQLPWDWGQTLTFDVAHRLTAGVERGGKSLELLRLQAEHTLLEIENVIERAHRQER